MKQIKPLNPFGTFVCSLGAIPTSYKESLSYEEQLLWLLNYIETVLLPAVNDNAEAIIELQNLYIKLKEYVDNYFSDLNVQNEINNKLDEMAEDGTLAKIINEDIFNGLNDKIGNLDNLTTDDKSSLVNAINEVDSHSDTNTANIGSLNNLTTDSKSSLVSAINEVDSNNNQAFTDIGNLNNLNTDNKSSLVNAINEVDTNINNLTIVGGEDVTFTLSNGNIINNNIRIAKSINKAICKLYGRIEINNLTAGNITLTSNDTGLRPSTNFSAYCHAVTMFHKTNGGFDFHTVETLMFSTDGKISVEINDYPTDGTYDKIYMYVLPAIIFVKDFGD